MTESCDILICGSGPAGLSAACAAAESGADVLLIEKLRSFGVKLLASGGGRCNFSNILSDADFMKSFGRSGRFMTEALRAGGSEKFREFLQSHGVDSEAEDGFHYFPVSGRSDSILNAFLRAASNAGVRLRTETRLASLRIENGALRGGLLSNGGTIDCKACILACGGSAMSALGGSTAGLDLARAAGHSVTPPLPAMSGIQLSDASFKALSGVSLPDAELSFASGKVHASAHGELLFTHDGLSGPAALDLSGPLYREWTEHRDRLALSVSFVSGVSALRWTEILDEWAVREGEKLFRSMLATVLPRSLAVTIADAIGLSEKKNSALSREDRSRAAKYLSTAPLHVAGLCPMEKAMAMSGGVVLKEVDPRTMESRIVSGLYFAGEILDLTGPCGGYNIQFAAASGRLAGQSAASKIQAVQEV